MSDTPFYYPPLSLSDLTSALGRLHLNLLGFHFNGVTTILYPLYQATLICIILFNHQPFLSSFPSHPSIHSDVCHVFVNDYPAHFQLYNYVEVPVADTREGLATAETFGTMYKTSCRSSDEGELRIWIPEPLQELIMKYMIGEFNEQDTENHLIFRVKVKYKLVDPIGGLSFVLPHEQAFQNRASHMFSHNLSGVRCWMPCVDTWTDRSTWDLEFLISTNYYLVAVGDCVDFQKDVTNRLKKITYRVSKPALASSICFAAGRFNFILDTVMPNKLSYYFLPGREALVTNTVGFIAQSVEHYERILNAQLPFGKYKIVFVDEMPVKFISGAGLTICSTHLLHPQDVIDQTYTTRRVLSIALASQWIGVYISVRSPPDLWIQFGILGYLANLNYQKMFGQNEYKSLILDDLNYLLRRTICTSLIQSELQQLTNLLATENSSSSGEHWTPLENKKDPISPPHHSQGSSLGPRFLDQHETDENTKFCSLGGASDMGNLEKAAKKAAYSLLHEAAEAKQRQPQDPHLVLIDFTECQSEQLFGQPEFYFNFLPHEFLIPLYHANYIHECEMHCKAYFKRATLVMTQLEKLVGGEGFEKILTNLVLAHHDTGLPMDQAISTSSFRKLCKKSTGQRIESFTDRNVMKHQFPHFTVSFTYSLAKNNTEIMVKQDLRICEKVSGQLLFRIHETDNLDLAIDHTMFLDEELQGASITSRSKPKLISFPPFPTYDTEMESQNGGVGDTTSIMVDSVSDHHSSHYHDLRATESVLAWLRIDPEMEWLCRLTFYQPDFMWINQLENDRDVGAQLQAINGIVQDTLEPSERILDVLYQILINQNIYYKIRMRVAVAISILSTKIGCESGINKLLNFFIENYFDWDFHPQRHPSQSATTPSTVNSFSTTISDRENGHVEIKSDSSINQHQESITPWSSTADSTNATTPSSTSTSSINTPVYHSSTMSSSSTPSSSFYQSHHHHHSMHHSLASSSNLPSNVFHGYTSAANNHWSCSSTAIANLFPNAQLRPNDFTDLKSYFIQKALIFSLALIRDTNNYTPSTILPFFLDLLNSNDNSLNCYSDNYYLGSLICAVSLIRSPYREDYILITRQIERHLAKERTIPCYHNVVAQSCLNSLAAMQQQGKIELELDIFAKHCAYRHYRYVRAVALYNYVRLGLTFKQRQYASIHHDTVFNFVFDFIQTDLSPWFRTKAASILLMVLEELEATKTLSTVLQCGEKPTTRVNLNKGDHHHLASPTHSIFNCPEDKIGDISKINQSLDKTRSNPDQHHSIHLNDIASPYHKTLMVVHPNSTIPNQHPALFVKSESSEGKGKITQQSKRYIWCMRTWQLLNSAHSAYDPRLRLHLMHIWQKLGGNKLASFHLPYPVNQILSKKKHRSSSKRVIQTNSPAVATPSLSITVLPTSINSISNTNATSTRTTKLIVPVPVSTHTPQTQCILGERKSRSTSDISTTIQDKTRISPTHKQLTVVFKNVAKSTVTTTTAQSNVNTSDVNSIVESNRLESLQATQSCTDDVKQANLANIHQYPASISMGPSLSTIKPPPPSMINLSSSEESIRSLPINHVPKLNIKNNATSRSTGISPQPTNPLPHKKFKLKLPNDY